MDVSVLLAKLCDDVAYLGMLVSVAVPLADTVPVEVPAVSKYPDIVMDFAPLELCVTVLLADPTVTGDPLQ